MFKKITHRCAVSDDGYKVAAVDMYTIKYEGDDGLSASVETDFMGTNIPIYASTLGVEQSSESQEISAAEILERISLALDFLNIAHEIVTE